MNDVQTSYQKAITFAATKHHGLKLLGTDLPYLVHLSNVAMEVMMAYVQSNDFDLNFAIQVALLHDVLEDTSTTKEELQSVFGKEITEAVSALTKDSNLSGPEKMQDSLNRIKQCRKEAWIVKLADRITNLQEPPKDWGKEKRVEYLEEAKIIASNLKDSNKYLNSRLEDKITQYEKNLS